MTTEEKIIPFKTGLWTVQPSGEARLLGSRCRSCGEVFFPRKEHGFCLHCGKKQLEDIELSPQGKIAHLTEVVQPPAGGFYHGPVPYYFGLVDLDNGVRVETHLDGDSEQLKRGTRVQLIIKTLYKDNDGNEVQIYSFQPINQETEDRG